MAGCKQLGRTDRPMAATRVIAARIPTDLYDRARSVLGLPEGTAHTEVIRCALATLAGLDPDKYAALGGGPHGPARPATKRTPQMT